MPAALLEWLQVAGALILIGSCSLGGYLVGKYKGKGVWGALLSLFLGPIGIIITSFLPAKGPNKTD
jgi:predicted methyltransferase